MEALLEVLERELMLAGRHSAMGPPGTACGPRALDRSAYVLLSRLQTDGPMSNGELAHAFRLDASTVHRQTGAMMRSGLVRRIPDPEGGMARKFTMTEEGAQRLAEDRSRIRSGLAAALEGWTSQDIGRLTEMLTRFNRSIETRDERPWPRPAPEPERAGTGGG
ncbi:MarR family winged helix-turn-helix transcriptional regulator [Nocardiopsis sediminis]|uniref:MarR family winged helix-turn-helix transcriptional regulator n=1 Tax=Nocardiopsis sediminis TaxID=1778267 RepID=A0ABV8FE49_9ACTN